MNNKLLVFKHLKFLVFRSTNKKRKIILINRFLCKFFKLQRFNNLEKEKILLMSFQS